MAKPIGNGKGEGNSALHRSWLIENPTDTEYFSATNQGDEAVQDGDGTSLEETILGSNRNDFFYIDPTLGFPDDDETPIYGNLIDDNDPVNILSGPEDPLLPYIDGLGGADQIIMMEEAIIWDNFFTNMENVTVLKLWDGNVASEEYIFTGSQVTLDEEAQEAGIREVTGGPGDDVIDFSGYVIEENDFGETIPLDIIIRGGAGADTMTASVGNDTFLWKAGDMEGTNTNHDDWEEGDSPEDYIFDKIIAFNEAGTDVLDISDLLIGFDDTFGGETEPEGQLLYLADWVEFTDEILYVDIDGGAEAFESEALVELQGVNTLDLLSDLIVC